MEQKKIAVLIPCYNEEKTIVKVIRELRKVLPEASIYVYDNNSTDHSYELVQKEKCFLRKEFRQGKGYVVQSMFREIEADCYLMIDGDHTYSVKQARKMCELVLEEKVDMVVGDRLSGGYFEENKRLFHNFGNKLICFLINILFSGDVGDVLSGYRAFSREFVKNFPILSKKFEIETEMTIFAIHHHFKISTIPVLYKDRIDGSYSKLSTYRDGFRILIMTKKLFKRYKPEVYYKFLSILFFIISLVFYFFRLNIVMFLIFFIISIFLFLVVSFFEIFSVYDNQLFWICLQNMRRRK